MIIKNITDGPKVVNSLAGPVTIPAGAEATVELNEAEHTVAMLMGWFEEVDGDGELDGMKVADLKALAEAEGIDLGDATKKADIIAAIELAREAAGQE